MGIFSAVCSVFIHLFLSNVELRPGIGYGVDLDGTVTSTLTDGPIGWTTYIQVRDLVRECTGTGERC